LVSKYKTPELSKLGRTVADDLFGNMISGQSLSCKKNYL